MKTPRGRNELVLCLDFDGVLLHHENDLRHSRRWVYLSAPPGYVLFQHVSLLEQMLDSHRDVEALGELPHIPALMRTMMEAATRHGIVSVPAAIQGLSPWFRRS